MDINSNTYTSTSSSNYTDTGPNLFELGFSLTFEFWYLLIGEILSLPCYCFVLLYILCQKSQRQAVHNHAILVLLFISFLIVLIDYSWLVARAGRGGQVWPESPLFCQIWLLIDSGFYNTCTLVLAWASFERHILIFYSNLIGTKRKLILFHYFPLIFILIYSSIFYIYVMFFLPCDNEFDFTLAVCGAYPCYVSNSYIAMWDFFINGITPTFLIAILNIALLLRTLLQKRRRGQDWRKCRKMAFHLISISALYLSLNLPMMIISVVQIFYSDWAVEAGNYIFFFGSLIQFILPYICLMQLPDLWTKIKIFFTRNNRRIRPTLASITMRRH